MVIEDDCRFQTQDNWTVIIDTILSRLQWSVIFGATVSFNSRGFRYVNSPHIVGLKPDFVITGTHCVIYNSQFYSTIIQLIENEVKSESPYHLDMLLSLNLHASIYLTVPFVALFTENDRSDVRVGKSTQIDYQNIRDSEQKAIFFINQIRNFHASKTIDCERQNEKALCQ